MTGRQPLLTYSSPPLVEVAISVQFDHPKGLNQAHLGAFWATHTQKSSYPHVRSVEAIPSTKEEFGSEGQWLPPSFQFEFTNEPACRLQMTSSDDQWMCQIQRDRLVINWRKRDAAYPRYSTTSERFLQTWRSWQTFLASFSLPLPKPRLWEVTYVNKVPRGELWETPADWPNVFPGLWGERFAAIPGLALQGFVGRWVWESHDPVSRLYVEPKPGRFPDDSPADVLLLSLTARGPVHVEADMPTAEIESAIRSGTDAGHVQIVSMFDQIASDDAKKAWGRYDNS